MALPVNPKRWTFVKTLNDHPIPPLAQIVSLFMAAARSGLSLKIQGQPVFRPLSDHILIEALDAPDKSKGGIILPEVAKERPSEGKVIAVGPGAINEQGIRIVCSVKKGDRVVFSKYGATELEVDGHKLTVVRDRDLLGVVE